MTTTRLSWSSAARPSAPTQRRHQLDRERVARRRPIEGQAQNPVRPLLQQYCRHCLKTSIIGNEALLDHRWPIAYMTAFADWAGLGR